MSSLRMIIVGAAKITAGNNKHGADDDRHSCQEPSLSDTSESHIRVSKTVKPPEVLYASGFRKPRSTEERLGPNLT